jgi:predicted transcriptional regulator
MVLDVAIREIPLSGIRSKEQLALFILASLGVSQMPGSDDEVQKVMPDIQILLNFMDSARKGDGIKVAQLVPKVNLKQTALYSRIRTFVNAGLIYKAKGATYKMKERTLAETLNFRIKKDIESRFSSIVDVAKELDNKIKEVPGQQTQF